MFLLGVCVCAAVGYRYASEEDEAQPDLHPDLPAAARGSASGAGSTTSGRGSSNGSSVKYAAYGCPRVHRPLSGDETLAELIREPGELGRATAAGEHGAACVHGGVLQLSNKEARPDPATGAPASLNFGGRVKLGSVKNFQMELGLPIDLAEDPAATDTPMLGADGARPLLLQFGKVARDEYILDFRHPLSPVQAFALGITALARKIASEGG